MATNFDIILRLTISAVLAGVIGLEREWHRRHAGLRTHIMVSLGSCLIMLTSLYVFDIYKSQAAVDPSRIAAGVITGIGFLGAGTIIRAREGVRGLTTASSLWVCSGIGLAVGCGFYTASVYATFLSLAVLLILRRFEKIIPMVKQCKGGGEDGI